MSEVKNKELIKDLIAREEWSVEYHTRSADEAKAKLVALTLALEGEPLDLDEMLAERRYHA